MDLKTGDIIEIAGCGPKRRTYKVVNQKKGSLLLERLDRFGLLVIQIKQQPRNGS